MVLHLPYTEDMNSGIVEVIQNVSSSNSVTNEIKFLAIEGEKTLKKTSLSMQEMNSSAKKVEEIVNVLQKISEQLSMLSINAAIESGRERETSSGFAVVAESIAKLSAKTGSNSKQAGIYLKEIWNTIHDSIHSIQETTISFQNIIEKIPHLTMYMKHVVESTNAYSIKTNIVHDTMKENSQTSSMITKEIVARFDEISEIHTLFERINQTSQEIKKELEELENMSLMLNGQTVKMHRAVDVFQIETNPT
jgi:methyl-accepting chemotaxis protein